MLCVVKLEESHKPPMYPIPWGPQGIKLGQGDDQHEENGANVMKVNNMVNIWKQQAHTEIVTNGMNSDIKEIYAVTIVLS